MRLCGVSAEQEGISRAVEELVDPSVGRYCDAELLFREEKLGAPRGVTGAGVSAHVGRAFMAEVRTKRAKCSG